MLRASKDELLYLNYLLPTVQSFREAFERGCQSELTDGKVYRMTLHMTGDEQKARRQQAWQKLNNMPS